MGTAQMLCWNKEVFFVKCSLRIPALLAAGALIAAVLLPAALAEEATGAPVAQDLSFSTYKNTAYTGRFSALDPEGELLTYQLVSKPARGAITMPEAGSDTFVYTPYENKTGKDSFTYVAIDASGNTSQSATVSLRIEKPDTKVTYADLDGHTAANAAIRLAEEGLFVGECLGGTYFFQPDAPMERSEFVALLAQATGLEALEDVTATGFADDDAIGDWARPYVASALKAGLVQGTLDETGQAVFLPDASITWAEASVLVDRALQITDVAQPTLGVDLSAAPVWAAQSGANLESVGLLEASSDGTLTLSGSLTRGEAAQLLCGALEVMDQREKSFWPFW